MSKRDMAETVPLMLGRAIFGGFFLYNGINHFLHKQNMAGYAEAKGIPAADVAVQASGAMMVLGGLSLLTGYKPKIGAGLIAAFLAGVTPSMHTFWTEENPQQRQNEMINFMKNVALLGGAMLAAGRPEPWPLAPAV
jgi:putative oxidoreductase